VDPRGKLVARSYDILGGVSFSPLHSVHSKIPICSVLNLIYAGLYSTFVFQKPDPDAIPPIVTPDINDADNTHEEVRSSLPSSYRFSLLFHFIILVNTLLKTGTALETAGNSG
jgi:hypothetical protein